VSWAGLVGEGLPNRFGLLLREPPGFRSTGSTGPTNPPPFVPFSDIPKKLAPTLDTGVQLLYIWGMSKLNVTTEYQNKLRRLVSDSLKHEKPTKQLRVVIDMAIRMLRTGTWPK